jgi:hypothetical protein
MDKRLCVFPVVKMQLVLDTLPMRLSKADFPDFPVAVVAAAVAIVL